MSSTRTLVTLLRPWIRRFTIIISAWWLRTSSKFTWEEVKTSTGKLGKWSTPKRVRIRPKYSAPSLSRDRRIKLHQSINLQDHQKVEILPISACTFQDLELNDYKTVLNIEESKYGTWSQKIYKNCRSIGLK